MEANNLVPDSLLRRIRADRGAKTEAAPNTDAPSAKSRPVTRRIALAMALSQRSVSAPSAPAAMRHETLIFWLGKG